MPHHKSAIKRVRQTKKRTELNKSRTTMTRSSIKKFNEAITAGEKEKAGTILVSVQSLLARLAKKGIIKPNTAARKTSRLTKALAKV